MVISRGNFRSFPMAFLGVSAFSPGTAVGGAGDLLHGLCLCGTGAKPPRGLLGRYGARRRGAQFTGRDAVRENRGLGMFDGIYDNIYIHIYIYIYIYMCVCLCNINRYVYIYMCVYVCMYVCMYGM